MNKFIEILKEKNVSMTSSRRIICNIIESANDHLTIEKIHKLAKQKDKSIGIATVYRTLNLLNQYGLIDKHEFGVCGILYEKGDYSNHHHHIVDSKNKQVTEFFEDDIDKALEKIARKYGYKMLGHKIEIYGEKIK